MTVLDVERERSPTQTKCTDLLQLQEYFCEHRPYVSCSEDTIFATPKDELVL